jgi:hypothetical protein
MKIKTYTDNQLIEAVKNSKSYAQVIKKLGLKQAGGTQKSIRNHIKQLNCDLSHFHYSLWSKGKQLKSFNVYQKHQNFRHHLFKQRGMICEVCNLKEWMGKQIPYEVHHIDANRKNNEESNLQILCNNCHAQTSNFRRRLKK